MALFFTPIVLSLLLLGAHLWRHGQTLLAIGTLTLIAMLLVRQAWVARAIQAALVLATAEWLRTLVDLIATRMDGGRPYLRLSIILLSVAAIAGWSAISFQTRQLGAFYGLGRRGDGSQSPH